MQILQGASRNLFRPQSIFRLEAYRTEQTCDLCILESVITFNGRHHSTLNLITPSSIQTERCINGRTDGRTDRQTDDQTDRTANLQAELLVHNQYCKRMYI